jgi:outer membrane biosynthesis protein TonB
MFIWIAFAALVLFAMVFFWYRATPAMAPEKPVVENIKADGAVVLPKTEKTTEVVNLTPIKTVDIPKPVSPPQPEKKPIEKPIAKPTPDPVTVSSSEPAPEVRPEPPREAITNITPNISSLSSEQRQQLPAMKLSMHVYANEASKRFAIIDGQRVNEGSLIGSAVVERISPEGVIVSIQGQSYLVPRP